MSKYTQTITAFIHLLENKPELFSTSDWADLEELITPFVDNAVGMSNALSSFCDSKPTIDEALFETQDILFPEIQIEKGAGGTGYPEMTVEDEKKLQEQLINIIRRNLPNC